MTESLTVYVPAPGSRLRAEVVREGSGMVGSKVSDTGRVRVDFEGDAELFSTYGARVRRAAERHTWTGPEGREGYPTRACAYVSPEELVAVGSYQPRQERVIVTDEGALKGWLGVESLGEDHLTVE